MLNGLDIVLIQSLWLIHQAMGRGNWIRAMFKPGYIFSYIFCFASEIALPVLWNAVVKINDTYMD